MRSFRQALQRYYPETGGYERRRWRAIREAGTMKVVFLSSLSWSLVNFRGALIARMIAEGHEVIACAPDQEPDVVATLTRMGARFQMTPMARAATNPLGDLRTFLHYLGLLRRERPDVVVAYTQKPIIYGGLAAQFSRRTRFFAVMSGLGYVFSVEADHRRVLRSIVSRLYRIGVRKAACIFVFNGDDRRVMLENGIINSEQCVRQVAGSGIDVRHFIECPFPDGPMTFLMMGRLMRDKGVGEYVAAARLVRERWPESRFLLLTRPETENPTGYSTADLEVWRREGLIEFIPETRDVRPHIAAAHVFVLPSFYREGLPRTILEALASGRPVITTDMAGCREPIRHGENGLLVPPRDAPALAAAMTVFLERPEQVAVMGRAARAVAVEQYDVDMVNATLLDAMQLGGVVVHDDEVPTSTPAALNHVAA